MYKLLKSIAEVKLGHSLREKITPDIGGNVFLLTPKDVSNYGNLFLNNATKITISNPEKHFIQAKEVLMTARGRFTATIFSPLKKDNFVVSSGFHRIKVTDINFLPEYIVLFLNSKEGQKALGSIQETATVPAITIKQIKKIRIPELSIQKQKQLINLTSSFSDWKALRQKQEELQSILINQIVSKIIGEQNG
jgi:restriction endonuclease S subunit